MRQVLIFGEESNSEVYQKQIRIFSEAEKGLKERDVTVKLIDKNDKKNEEYKIPNTNFHFLLIGKDGTEKYRTSDLLKAEMLFSMIDAMPMRRQEIKQSNNNSH